MHSQSLLVCLYLVLMFPTNIIGLWWAVGSPLVMDPNSICRKSRRLVGKQRKICRKEPEIVQEVAKGAKEALIECQYQFRNEKWNCTSRKRSLSKILRRDTREAAFLYSVTAAGVVYAVTQACSQGALNQCSCHSSARHLVPDEGWKWGGCGDDVDFGYRKSQEFMDARRNTSWRGDVTTLIQLHNNEAGRRAVKNYTKKDCKCHGLSGSCQLKTCWMKMPQFREVGTRLKESFKGATRVTISNDGGALNPENKDVKQPAKDDLVYSENSPDFCTRSKSLGTLGTTGRVCNPNDIGVGGCDIMCCNRGYSREEVTVMENCKCRFKWCCNVSCETCHTVKNVYRCL